MENLTSRDGVPLSQVPTPVSVSYRVQCRYRHRLSIIAPKGIGYEVAKGLLLRGIRTVILACRNESKGRAAAEALLTETGREFGAAEFRYLDVASFASVRAFANKYKNDGLPLHVLVHNAGVHGVGSKVMTEDGLDFL